MENALELTQSLRSRGIDADIDQFYSESGQNWPVWMQKAIANADFVLCLASPLYKERFEASGDVKKGLGSRWEGAIITEGLYAESLAADSKFIAVVPEGCNSRDIPSVLQPLGRTHYRLPDDDEDLYRRLTGQPRVLPLALGDIVVLPHR
jgi:hypothetical protein